MCRILAVNSAAPIESSRFRDFPQLCSKSSCGPHKDGWGLTSVVDGAPSHLGRESKAADAADSGWSTALAALDASKPTGTVIAHIRSASVGDIRLENTQPYIHAPWAFAHNGTIRNFDSPTAWPMEGDSDSERYFKIVVPHLEMGQPPVVAIAKAMREVRGRDHTSLTCVFSDGPRMFAIHDSKKPEEHGLQFASHEGAIVVAQEPLFQAHWRAVENQHVLIAEHGRLKGVLPLFRL